MDSELPFVARRGELAALTGGFGRLNAGRGEAVLVTGEAGVGKTRLLSESRQVAESSGLLTLRGRAIETGGAYRPLVDAFARRAAPFADDPRLVSVRPALARVLPGWIGRGDVLAPMADPTAVLAEALIRLLGTMAPNGAVLILDDLQWADDDTLSVVAYLADSVEEVPLTVLGASRAEPGLPPRLEALITARSVHLVPLVRLMPADVMEVLSAAGLPDLPAKLIDQLVDAVDGLPLVLDEFVRHLRDASASATELDVTHTTLATAVQLRLSRLSLPARAVLDALSVLGETDISLLGAATGLDPRAMAAAIHEGVSSTLLVPAPTPLGVAWRHRLMRDAVRNLLLPLEQQEMARRAADHIKTDDSALSDYQLRQAATLYQIAGYPSQAAQLLVHAARAAVRAGGLNAAEQYLTDAQTLTGSMTTAAQEVMVERLEVLTLAGRAGDAYENGNAALSDPSRPDSPAMITATARAAVGAGLVGEAAQLLARLENGAEPTDLDVALLRAHCALADRRPEALELGKYAARLACDQNRFDVACEAWVIVGRIARRWGTDSAANAFGTALSLSRTHQLPVWQVSALAELGMLDLASDSDPTRFHQARDLAVSTGMVGVVASTDLWIGAILAMRNGYVAAYPTFARADTLARQLRLVHLQARARAQIAQCVVNADGQPLPGRARPTWATEADEVVAEALVLGLASDPVEWASCALGLRAWFQGDDATGIRVMEKALGTLAAEQKFAPMWGMWALLRVVTNTEAAAALEVIGENDVGGHHINRGALAYGRAILAVRHGDSGDEQLAEAEHHLRPTPYARHLLRTMVAPYLFKAGVHGAQDWLREADAFCSAAGERALQRRVRQALAATGAKLPRSAAGTVPPHLAAHGITARETEILELVNLGLSNADIASRLFLSHRTVETHVSSLLQKTGRRTREELPFVSGSA